jgi:hypothetical protein
LPATVNVGLRCDVRAATTRMIFKFYGHYNSLLNTTIIVTRWMLRLLESCPERCPLPVLSEWFDEDAPDEAESFAASAIALVLTARWAPKDRRGELVAAARSLQEASSGRAGTQRCVTGACAVDVALRRGWKDVARVLCSEEHDAKALSHWRALGLQHTALYGPPAAIVSLLLSALRKEDSSLKGASAVEVASEWSSDKPLPTVLLDTIDAMLTQHGMPDCGGCIKAIISHWPALVGLRLSAKPSGCSLLHCAATRGSPGAVEALIKAGANPDDLFGNSKRWTALHCAASADLPPDMGPVAADVAACLLANGAAPDLADAQGRTPTWVSFLEGDASVGTWLLEHGGADPNVSARGCSLLLALLLKRGAREADEVVSSHVEVLRAAGARMALSTPPKSDDGRDSGAEGDNEEDDDQPQRDAIRHLLTSWSTCPPDIASELSRLVSE